MRLETRLRKLLPRGAQRLQPPHCALLPAPRALRLWEGRVLLALCPAEAKEERKNEAHQGEGAPSFLPHAQKGIPTHLREAQGILDPPEPGRLRMASLSPTVHLALHHQPAVSAR